MIIETKIYDEGKYEG